MSGRRLGRIKLRTRPGGSDPIEIPVPCRVPWDSMVTVGSDDKARFCCECKKTVHNVEGLTKDELKALLTKEQNPCVRIFRRPDGTVMTSDCTPRRTDYQMPELRGRVDMVPGPATPTFKTKKDRAHHERSRFERLAREDEELE